MIPTLRLYLLLLPGAALVAGVAFTPLMLWVAVAYLVVVAVLAVADYLLTDRPTVLEVERIHDSRLSLGANNPVTILIASRARRPLTLQIRDEHPDDIPADATILVGKVEPFALLEVRYHLRPVRRGDYDFWRHQCTLFQCVWHICAASAVSGSSIVQSVSERAGYSQV